MAEIICKIETGHDYIACPECTGDDLVLVEYTDGVGLFEIAGTKCIRCVKCTFEIKDWPKVTNES